jgi:hypothetical protein
MKTYSVTPVLFVKEFKAGRDTQATSFKGILKEKLAADSRAGKFFYTLEEIYKVFSTCYALVGSKDPVGKAKLTWSMYAKPERETWFI